MKNPLKVPPAAGVCDNCLMDRDRTRTNGQLIAVFCEHNRAGAVMLLMADGQPSNFWRIYTPVSAEEFSNAVFGATEWAKKEFDFHGVLN